MEKIILPSIIAVTQEEVNKRINKVKDYAEWLQLDVMDGKFVPTHSLDFDFDLPETNCRYEAHLMVNNPEDWINKHIEKVDALLFHIEPCKDPKKIIQIVKDKGKKIGLAINPETSLEKIKPYLDDIDEVIIMTVTPGFYGSPFLPEQLIKVKELRNLKPILNIEVDGGINDKTIKQASDAGANLFISGSYIVKSDDVQKAINTLKNLII